MCILSCIPSITDPFRYQKGGVLYRPGHTEAAVDLSKLAGLAPVGVLSEIVSRDGLNMARGNELWDFCREHGLVSKAAGNSIVIE